MSRGALRRARRFLGSARTAAGLLAFIAAWAVLASVVPQDDVTATAVAAWRSSHPALAVLARTLGLHHAFTAPLFVLAVVMLAASTSWCAAARTRVALRRSQALRQAAAPAAGPDEPWLNLPCDPALGSEAATLAAARVLGDLGLRARISGSTVRAASRPWTVWGSPVFHWALVALITLVALGGLVRSSGQMGIAVGHEAIDRAPSYGTLRAGPLKSWRAPRTIRVDAFDVNYTTGGVDRGPTPTVTVLDAKGDAIATQRVYPNHTLKTGSLAVYPADYGLAAELSLLASAGVEPERRTVLLDFSGRAEGGTVPVAPLAIADESGSPRFSVAVSVPLDRVGAGYLGRLPEDPRARIVVTSAEGDAVLDAVLRPGESAELPTGERLRLDDVTYYARLQVVDDPTVLWLYAVGAVAMLGLGVATFARQLHVVASVTDTPEGLRLEVAGALWRNAPVDRGELGRALERAVTPSVMEAEA